MNHFFSKSLILSLALFSLAAKADGTDSKLPVIGGVWDLSVQPCNGGGGNLFNRDPREAEIKKSRVVELPSLKAKFKIPKLPFFEQTAVKIYLGDKSRGVIDNYILLADPDLDPPKAAVVITELPEDYDTAKAFAAVNDLERGLSKGADFAFEKLTGPYGDAIEFQLPNRVGTHCFPTSTFKLAPTGTNSESVGISRFVFTHGYLVEFALIVPVESKLGAAERKAYARKTMDNYWTGLSFD
jgi:hypothetical protein